MLLLEVGADLRCLLGKAPWYSSLEEFQNPCNKLFVILEDAAVSGVTIEGSEFGIWQTSSQVDSVLLGTIRSCSPFTTRTGC